MNTRYAAICYKFMSQLTFSYRWEILDGTYNVWYILCDFHSKFLFSVDNVFSVGL